MDERVQETEAADPVGDEGVAGRAAQPREEPKGFRGRPKKRRPAAPGLTDALADTLGHFFPELGAWFAGVDEARKSGTARFPLPTLLLLGTLMFVAHSGSRNLFNGMLRDSGALGRTLADILGAGPGELPHLDTLEKALRGVPPEGLEGVLALCVRRLIRMKALDGWRSGGRFLLAVDGTGLWSFRERHCPHCVRTEHAPGAVTYSHKLLVAFIVSADGYALPVACEFIENPGEAYDKQDCETKAFHRLRAKLTRLFPQTPFRLLLDALYADRNVMAGCAANGWDFVITFKEGDMPALWREAQALLALEPGNLARVTHPKERGGGSLEARWAGGLDYHGLTLSAVFQTERDGDGNVLKSFAHLVLRAVDRDNCLARAADGRLRWRCENEGFNTLKNGGFALEHVYSHNGNASKCYVQLMLLAHIVQQLVTRGRLGAAFAETAGTFKAYGKRMLAALLNTPPDPGRAPPGQIRLSTA